MSFKNCLIGAASLALIAYTGTAFGAEPIFGGNTISAKSSSNMSNMTMTVTGPDGYYAKEFSAHSAPFLSLQKNGGLKDGLYKWEITGSTNELVEANPMGLDNGRGEKARRFVNKSVTESGSFRVMNGSILPSNASGLEQLSLGKGKAYPDADK